MKSLLNKISLLLSLFIGVFAHHADEWKSRTIYQLLTDRFYPDPPYTPPTPPTPENVCPNLRHYCKGTYKGMIEKLDYVKNMGFDAIWITPIVQNLEWAGDTQGYHGYWMTALYELNQHFGTADDLKKMVEEAHKRDIWVMVDIVANHAGPIGQNYTQFSKELNKPEHYHEFCIVEDEDHPKNQWRMERCWLAGLADFNHENPYVVNQLTSWISWMVKEFNIDGIRIDTIPHVPHNFWSKFNEAAGVYQVGEALDDRADYVGSYQNYLEAMLNYPLFFGILHGFTDADNYSHKVVYPEKSDRTRSLIDLESQRIAVKENFRDHTVLGTFVDNHDHRRFLNINPDIPTFKHAMTFILFSEGIPIIYYGSEQAYNMGGDPESRQAMFADFNEDADIYKFLKNVIAIRKSNSVWGLANQDAVSVDVFQYAFVRYNDNTDGKSLLIALTNQIKNQTKMTGVDVSKAFARGDKICDTITDLKDCLTVSADGKVDIVLEIGALPKVYAKVL